MHDVEKIAASVEASIQHKASLADDASLRSYSTAMDKSLGSSFIDVETYDFDGHEKPRFFPDIDFRSKNASNPSLHTGLASSLQFPHDVNSQTANDAPCMSLIHQIAFIFIACLAQFLSLGAMNQTVAPVLVLAKYFDVHDYGNLSWFSAAYSMTVGTFILPAGR
jgi:hypothetical protein